MDIGRSFSYMFEDKDWPKKLLYGGLINLVPIFQLTTQGYALRIIRQVSQGQEPTLPEWDDIGKDWVKGLLQFLAVMILLVPVIPGLISIFIADESVGPGRTDPWVVCCFGVACLSFLWALLTGLVFPMARVHYARTDEFASFFRFRTLFKAIGRHLEDYIVVLLLILVVGSVASMVGAFICLFGTAFTGFYAQLVIADLLGQVEADDDTEKKPRPAPPAPRPSGTRDLTPVSSSEVETTLEAQVEQELGFEVTPPDETEDYGGPEA